MTKLKNCVVFLNGSRSSSLGTESKVGYSDLGTTMMLIVMTIRW